MLGWRNFATGMIVQSVVGLDDNELSNRALRLDGVR